MGRIGITCYPSIGGSGILACALGEELAARGHEVHFISYERPVRVALDSPRLRFHPVAIREYGLFRYPDYTLPLSVKMAEVSAACGLDVLHVHYAVPHATAAVLARSMLSSTGRPVPRIVTTLHGTDTTLLGRDPGYGPAIRHALVQSDVVTTVSHFLRDETRRLLQFDRPIEVVHNFFTAKPARRSRGEVRRELGVADGECLVFHSSNLRPLKRVDLLLQAAAGAARRFASAPRSFRLLILAGEDIAPHVPLIESLGLADRVIIRERVIDVEEYLQACDLSLYASEMESFCLGILEGMAFGCPAVAFGVGGIPELLEDGAQGRLVPFGDVSALSAALAELIADPRRRQALGASARERALARFSAAAIVPLYERLYGF